MIILGISTSSPRAEVAIQTATRTEVLGNDVPRQHGEWLHSAVHELLQRFHVQVGQLSCVAIDLGPGSFTGLRVGFQLAQTFCFAAQIPMMTATSSEIFATSIHGKCIVAQNAFRNLVYFDVLEKGRSQVGPQVCSALDFRKQILEPSLAETNITYCGDAFTSVPVLAELQIKPLRTTPEAESLVSIAKALGPDSWTKDWKLKNPLYLRGSEAEEKAKI